MESKLSINSEIRINNIKVFLWYLLIFYIVWACKELWLIQYIESFGGTVSAILNALVKVSVWIVPAWLYIKYYLNTNPIDYLKMNVNVRYCQ